MSRYKAYIKLHSNCQDVHLARNHTRLTELEKIQRMGTTVSDPRTKFASFFFVFLLLHLASGTATAFLNIHSDS